MNKCILLGNLGDDPQVKYTQNGTSVANFSIATSEKWKDKTSGENKESTEWHRVVVWGKQAEHCGQYLNKGSSVLVEGKVQTRSYDDKDGYKRYITEVIASNVTFLGKDSSDKSEASETPKQEQKEYKIEVNPTFGSDDIPF